MVLKNLTFVLSNFSRKKHTLPNLGYDYKALEPIISGSIMEIHHSKHHSTYVNNYNIAEENLRESLEKKDVGKIISLENSLKFNGGGHINHSIFWKNLSPNGGGSPTGRIAGAIEKDFKSFEGFKKAFKTLCLGVQGSGWGWLGYCKNAERLVLKQCPNQDPLHATTGLIPLLGFDVWEHAYYLQYKNNRGEYLDKIWDIVNWKDVEERYNSASE